MRIFKKYVSVLLIMTMIVSLFTVIPFEVSAETSQRVYYKYRYWDADSNTVKEVVTYQDDVKPLSSCKDNTSLSGWYYTDESFEVNSRVKVADTAYIILTKGKTVTFKKGIRVADGKELNIYPDDKSDNGKLIATADGYDAAIGSNDEDDGDEDKAGTVNIYGGTIVATGGTDGAGIGGGNEAKGGTVNIYGGSVTARGGNFAAGIGGGDECSGGTVTIYGGSVTAYGGQDAAGIGGGEDGSGADYTQYGGRVYATGGKADSLSSGGGAGVGGGECGSQGGSVNIHGGYLSSRSGSFGGAAAIGGGHDASGGTVNITGGTVQATGEWGSGIGGGEYHSNGTVNITGGTVKAESAYGAGIGSAFGKNNRQGGDILIENASVTAIAKGYSAGIGGGGHENEGGSATKITIRNSAVYAGSSYGAGIGGAGVAYGNDDGGHGGTVIIEGSSVFAISKERGAGIGGGCSGDGGTVTIKDSYVEAYGGSSSYNYINDTASFRGLYKSYFLSMQANYGRTPLAGLAAEYDAKVADVIVALILNDTWGGAGIGGGSNGRGANVTITGYSTVIAGGGRSGAVAIGHGLDNSENRTLTLSNNLIVQTGSDMDSLQTASTANRVAKCQSKQFAVITPCKHTYATYRGVFEGHAIDSCPDCAITFDDQELEPHSFPNRKTCSVCFYEGVKIEFDSDGHGGHMDSVYITKGYDYTLPDQCAFSILNYDSKTYYLCGWKINDTEYSLGETITVDEDITVVGVFARGNIDVIESQNGHVNTDTALAPPGTTITLTAVPDTDCRLTSIRVTAGEETIYQATEENDGTLGLTHQFTMPEGYGGVSVRSVFEKNQHKIWIDDESFSSLDAADPTVLVNGFESGTAALGDEITVIVPVDSSVVSIICYPVDSSGTITENSRNHSRSYSVGGDGKAIFTWFVQSDIKIAATHDHTHDLTSFRAWGSGYGEDTSLPNTTGAYYLTEDITLSQPWYLQSNIMLCLNGHKITPADDMDYMIHVGLNRQLYIYDHDNTGAIDGEGKCGLIVFESTGGNVTLNGGTLQNGFGGKAAGVYINDYNTFTMHGGVITGMQADWDALYTRGAGVYVNGGKFIMDGGKITDSDDGWGVYVEAGRFELSRNPVISGNGHVNSFNGDVFLSRGNVINITGKLSVTARIGVRTYYGSEPKTPIIVTNGYSGNGDLVNFFTTDPDLAFGVVDGELSLGAVRTVTFDMNGGTPNRVSETAALGGNYVLPQNTASKAASVFIGWKVDDTDTVLSAGETIFISDNVTLHAVWSTADEYAYIEDHVHRWEIKIDEDDFSKVTVRCLDGDQCNEGDAKYAQLQINGTAGTYTTTYNGSAVTASVYKQPKTVNTRGFYDGSLIHVGGVFYTDVMGEVMDSAPVDAGVYFANATISPASGKGEPATICQMIIINKAQPDVTVTGSTLRWTRELQRLVESTDISDGSIVYRINDGEWTLDPSASEIGEYKIEWYYVGENYANVHSAENPGVVYSSIADEHTAGEPVRENEVIATCTHEGGYDSVTYCLNCGIEMSREHIVLEKLPHTEQIVPGTPADCSHTGLTDGKICSVCGEVLVEQQVIPEAHEFGEPVWAWAADHSAAAATFVCGICGKEVSFDANITESYNGGKMVYSATVTVSGKTYSDTVTVDYTMTYSYIDANGNEKTAAAKPLTSDMTALESGWYAVDSDFTVSDRIVCSGDVHLILCDGSTLTAYKGIGVNRNGSITIYGQSGGTGALKIDYVMSENAGIGGRDCVVTINGGTISVQGATYAACIGGDYGCNGTVTINGGTVYAKGYKYGSGIGGGYHASGNVTINGGTVSTTADNYITGIGSGYNCSSGETVVTINDGTVEVIGEHNSLCIGGFSQKSVEVIINGGSVTTSSTEVGIGIGCRHASEPNASEGPLTVTINGGQVTARADLSGYGIGNYSSSINLGWSSMTDSVTVDRYYGTVTLTKPFTDGTSVLGVGVVSDVETIRGKTLTPYAPTSWAELQMFIDDAESGDTITLCQNYAATDSDTALIIPAGKEIILDLNGYTLDRNLSAAAEDGRVIVNNGILTIKDSSAAQTGTVTGGYYNGDGGAILNNKTRTLNIEGGNFTGNTGNHGGVVYNMGTMNMTGGSMYGNTANGNGGAVWNGRQGVLNLSGGVITDNTYGEGGAVYSRQDGTLNVFGSPIVTENGNSNIYLRQAIVNVTGALNSDAKLAVTCEDVTDGFVFTSGLSGNGTAENFVSDQSGYNVCLNDDGEAVLKRVYTITLDTTENCAVEASASTAYEGDTVTLTITPDEGYSVTSVTVNGAEITPEDGVYSFVMPDEDVTVSATFGFADGIGARLVGHSISLDGDIGVNFYMELSDSIANSDTAYMHFTIPAGSITTEQNVYVKDARQVVSGNKTYYVFKCQVAAKEMTSQIKAQIIDGELSGTEYTYSVKEYADYLLAHTDEREDLAKAAPLVRAMLNYGAYSQLHFDQNPDTLANCDLNDTEKALGDVQIDVADPVVNDLPEGVTFEGATLSLKSETTLSLYFSSSEMLTFNCEGYTVETVKSGNYQIARIRGIKAKHIGNTFILNVNGGTVAYSPLNYCRNVLAEAGATPDEAQNQQDEKLQNVVKALYLYWQAAEAYFPE